MRQQPDTPAVLCIQGPMTIYEAPTHKRAILQALASGGDLALDLSGVDEIDSAGLQLLLLARREARTASRGFRLAGASEAVREVLARYRLQGTPDEWLGALDARAEEAGVPHD